MSVLNLFGPKVFESPVIVAILSYFIQNTSATLLILSFFVLVILQEPISYLFIGEGRTEYQSFEAKYFWQTMVLIPIVSVPFIWVMQHFGIFEIYTTIGTVWLMALQLVVMIILHDSYFYWCHRLLHTQPFWNIHGIHHQASDPTVLTSHVFHYIETIINYTFLVWFTLFAGLTVGGIFFIPAVLLDRKSVV